MNDLISRQDVYCILEKMMVDRPLDSDRWVIRDIDKEIKSLSSVDRPIGHWIYKRIRGIKTCKCSECLTSYGCMDTPYCPNCGADMRGEQE